MLFLLETESPSLLIYPYAQSTWNFTVFFKLSCLLWQWLHEMFSFLQHLATFGTTYGIIFYWICKTIPLITFPISVCTRDCTTTVSTTNGERLRESNVHSLAHSEAEAHDLFSWWRGYSWTPPEVRPAHLSHFLGTYLTFSKASCSCADRWGRKSS